MEEIIDVLIVMGATRVIYNEHNDGEDDESLTFIFNGKQCKILSGGCHGGIGYLTGDVSDE